MSSALVSLAGLVLTEAIVLVSIILHEVAHGLVARERGDDTAARAGRLTLNPLAHLDPIGSVVIPLTLGLLGLPVLGWAKPVPVRPALLRNPRQDWMMVALAGPATNLALALAAAGVLRLPLAFSPLAVLILIQVVVINVALAVFNLLPIPPMDGSRVVMRFLPPRALETFLRFEGGLGMTLVFLLLAVGLLGMITGPIQTALVGRLLG